MPDSQIDFPEQGARGRHVDREIIEAVLIAAALRAGGAITRGTHAMNGSLNGILD
jgi:hypothetical protein